jgi:secretion/DNA translocation related TadE-like protein
MLVVAMAVALRGSAVLARHRAETAADLAALAAAGQIGVGADVCDAAARVAAANGALLQRCVPQLDPGGREGTVSVEVAITVHLPVAGVRLVSASARAAR